MKKRILALLLAVAMACALCACGGSAGQGPDKPTGQGPDNTPAASSAPEEAAGPITMADLKRDKDGRYVVTEKQLAACLEKITLTTENWSQYFGDYQEVRQTVNAFGDVEREYTVYGFGLKPEYHGVLSGVAFKFAGQKERVQGYFILDPETGEYIMMEDGFIEYPTGNCYDLDLNLIGELNCEPKEYFVTQFNDYLYGARHDDGYLYADYECLDVMGELILIHLPDELFQEEQVVFGNSYSSSLDSTDFGMLDKYVK